MSRLAATAAVVLFFSLPTRSVFSREVERVEREVYLMGTQARLETYVPSRQEGMAAVDRALAILEDAEGELSTWREQSAISALNRHPVGRAWHANTDLCRTFAELYRFHEVTRGTFDPAIGRLTDAWGIHESGRVPSPKALLEARRTSGLQLIAFDEGACTLTRRDDVRLDVGAWGKGDALDRVRRGLPNLSWLISLGGQIAVNGAPPGFRAWTVSLAHPLSREEPLVGLWLREGSLSTSAGSERDLWVKGRRVAHHLDPRTGEPASFDGSVSVWHQSALVADAFSTALYVMGPDEGLKWAEAHDVAVCYLIPQTGSRVAVRMTEEFRVLLSP